MTWDIKTGIRIQYEKPSGTWNSIQCDTFEVSIDRGIDVQEGVFARPSVGTAEIRLMKSSLADFINGPDYQSNQRIRIEWLNGSFYDPLFYGFIQNIDMSYVVEAKSLQVNITANDMGRIALNTDIPLMIVGSGSSRSFINVMNQLEALIKATDSRYDVTQFLTGGSSTFQQQSYVFEETNSGAIYQHLLDAELGWLWASPFSNGDMEFMTRTDVATQKGSAWDSTALTVSNIHSTSLSHVCMDNMQLAYNSDNIANQVRVTNGSTGVKTTATNTSSVTAYGRQLADFEVIFDGVSPSSTYAQWASAVANAANPKAITNISVPVITDTGFPSLIILRDVGEPLQVEFASAGLPTLQEKYLMTRHNHVITAEHWEMNIGLWRGI
jgi:hypothetical protein